MDPLRISLIVIGILIVAGVYLWSRRDADGEAGFMRDWLLRRPAAKTPPDDDGGDIDLSAVAGLRATPGGDEAGDPGVSLSALDEPDPDWLPAGLQPLIIVFRVMAPQGTPFDGARVREVLESLGFAFGDMRIFHQPAGENDPRPVCSVANALEPGDLVPGEMEQMTMKGLTLFMRLPGPVPDREVFERTLDLGRRLAEELGGELCDESRSALTAQTVSHLRESIEAFRFKLNMAQIRQRYPR